MPSRRRTLRGRVALIGIAVIAAWVLVLTVAFNLLFARRLSQELDTVLRTRATTAAATLVGAPDGTLHVHDPVGDGTLDSGIWVYAGGRTLERPRGSARLQQTVDELASGPQSFNNQHDNRLFVLPVIRGGTRIATVVALATTTPYERAQKEALFDSVVLGLLLLVGAYPVLRFAVARALRPVALMADQAGQWSAHELTQRFGPRQRYREMQTLARTLDGVLDRLSAIVRHEKDLSAELSHELRTPLSRIVAETDLLLARSPGEDRDRRAHAAIHDGAMAMEHLLATLFATTRTELRHAPGRCEARDVAETAAQVAVRGGTTPVTVTVPPGLIVGVEAAVVQRILMPLLDNAQRYARTGVVLSAQRLPDAIALDVLDDGPGIAENDRDAVFEPGRRCHPDDGHDGAGLGLALARRLARAAAGDVIVATPGSRLRIVLPPG